MAFFEGEKGRRNATLLPMAGHQLQQLSRNCRKIKVMGWLKKVVLSSRT
jgi:hypothetical protein